MAEALNEAAAFCPDPDDEIRKFIPSELFARYRIFSFRHAAAILEQTATADLHEVFHALAQLKLTKAMIIAGGGNESAIPKELSKLLRPMQWLETEISGDLKVILKSHSPGNQITDKVMWRRQFLDGHKIDYVKNRIALDLEWNSKDQTFDRDLYALRAFYECGVISAGILITRDESLNPIFSQLGIKNKYGASTTWIGKLLPRISAGRNGGCPLLIFAITPHVISDLDQCTT